MTEYVQIVPGDRWVMVTDWTYTAADIEAAAQHLGAIKVVNDVTFFLVQWGAHESILALTHDMLCKFVDMLHAEMKKRAN